MKAVGQAVSHKYKVAGLTLGATAALSAAFLAGKALAAGIPATSSLNYAGTLTEPGGAPLTGDHTVEVRFWDAGTDGTTLCTSGVQSVTLAVGRFSVALPDTCTDVVKGRPDVWVQVVVDASELGRAKVGAVPYAVEAAEASAAVGPLAEAIDAKLDRSAVSVRACPADTVRIGTHCIDVLRRDPANVADATLICHEAGMTLCSLDQIWACDNIGPPESTCTADTDATMTLWTGSVDSGGPANGRAISYQNNDLEAEVTSTAYAYYCCIPTGVVE